MSTTTIGDLPDATTPLTGNERVPMDQADTTVDATTQDIADLAGAAITAAIAAHDDVADPHNGASPTFADLTLTGLLTAPHIHGTLAGDVYVHVKNTSGGTLAANTAVYVTGSVGDTDRVEVAACDPTDPAKMPAIGLLKTALANNAEGDAVILGELRPTDTSSYTLGDELYVGAGGALVSTIPASGTVQRVGSVARVQSETGTIVVGIGAGMARAGFTGAYGDLSGTPSIPAAADATPQPLGTAAIGISTDYARVDHVHVMPSAGDVGADPAGTASSAISTHEAAADPHPGYALESSLGGAALLDVGTTAGTVAAGDDSRFTTDLTYTASTRVLASSTGADATLPLFTSTEAGLTPLSGGGTTNFLRADGTWAAPVSGGTPGGTTGQIQWNSSGSFAGVSGSTVGASGDITLSANGAASTPPVSLTGTWFTGGTATTTKPQLLIEPTGTTSTSWSTSGTGLGVNAASGFTGNLLDLQVNGTHNFNISSTGAFTAVGGSSGVNNSGFIGGWNAGAIGFSASAIWAPTVILDVMLRRDGPGIFAQRNSTNAQTFRCYGSFTDSSNYVRAALSSTSTAVTLAAETAGTGADDIPLNLTAAGTGTVKVNSVTEVAVSSTVAGLPATPAVGMLTRVTDATAPAVGFTVAGGGAAAALVWWNGSNWTVIGV